MCVGDCSQRQSPTFMLACGLKQINATAYDCEIAQQYGQGQHSRAAKVQEQVSPELGHAVARNIIIWYLLFYLDLLSTIYRGWASLILAFF